ncbi:hypothetical protein N473_18505 [Pseudoalteromonas luteoviolacea CPMOR-1]|uniref:Uncharacterized protein n=1 Tax=Pseudoalteromonas luteoviolacea CPMOR-1 TaxID=1365248 RepID=A0A167KD88_9GAMM|nr:hypothetical protein [Pseudoalteromonas luteoviolacea]KZN62622.1 hypothetical protein N473_18505 [Pseudoalteromonas luteoviolacea CPMOR-1]
MKILIKKCLFSLEKPVRSLQSLDKSKLRFISGGTNGGGIDPHSK